MARMWEGPQQLTDWPVNSILDTIRSAQDCQKRFGMSHALNPLWSRAINEGCAEIARRCKLGDSDALNANL